MEKLKLLCAVGDARHLYMCSSLAERYDVYAVGCIDLPRGVRSIGKLSGRADALVLPMLNNAASREGDVFVRCAEGTVRLTELLWHLNEGAPVLGALPTAEAEALAASMGHRIIDYFKDAELVRQNCIPTAEAALEIAMHRLDVTVKGTKTLIIGFGNVASECARVFGALGSEITCAVRREETAQKAAAAGFGSVLITPGRAFTEGFDIIINTAPALVIDETQLLSVKRGALIIDLASKPGGTDFDAAARLGVRAVHALALPGKYAPVSAGEYIADTADRILKETITKGE